MTGYMCIENHMKQIIKQSILRKPHETNNQVEHTYKYGGGDIYEHCLLDLNEITSKFYVPLFMLSCSCLFVHIFKSTVARYFLQEDAPCHYFKTVCDWLDEYVFFSI